MKLSELSNEEIVFLYLLINDVSEQVEEVLEDGGLTYVMDSPLGKIQLFGAFTEKELEDLKESPKVLLSRSISEKLEPVFGLISEANQDVVDAVRDSLFPKKENDQEEEDL
jgi:hypothetical protein